MVDLFRQGGDLSEAIDKDKEGKFTWYRQGRAVALDIAKGIAFLHSMKIVHR